MPQVDAAINSGNSGGPAFSDRGGMSGEKEVMLEDSGRIKLLSWDNGGQHTEGCFPMPVSPWCAYGPRPAVRLPQTINSTVPHLHLQGSASA